MPMRRFVFGFIRNNYIHLLVKGLTTSKGLSFAFQANSPYVNDFTLGILRLHENDFLDGLKRKWWDRTSTCPEEEVGSKHNALNNNNCYIAGVFSATARTFIG